MQRAPEGDFVFFFIPVNNEDQKPKGHAVNWEEVSNVSILNDFWSADCREIIPHPYTSLLYCATKPLLVCFVKMSKCCFYRCLHIKLLTWSWFFFLEDRDLTVEPTILSTNVKRLWEETVLFTNRSHHQHHRNPEWCLSDPEWQLIYAHRPLY